MIPRAVLVQEFYEGAAIPPWTDVTEQILPAKILPADLEARGVDAWHLPLRGILRGEAQVAEFFQSLISRMQEGAERRSSRRELYEAIRRLPAGARSVRDGR